MKQRQRRRGSRAALSLRTGICGNNSNIPADEIHPSPENGQRDNNAAVLNLRPRLLDRSYQLSHAANNTTNYGSGSDLIRGFPKSCPWDLRAQLSPPICSPKVSLLVAMLEIQIRKILSEILLLQRIPSSIESAIIGSSLCVEP